MKRGILIAIVTFIVFISLSLVSSANSCGGSQDQIILRLSADTNAHGEVFNGAGAYITEICYDQIFGVFGNGNRACNGANTVLRLSADTNAHGEGPSGTSYTTQICYGDLNCRLTSACSANERAVVRLSSATNAHLETASETNYNNLICCAAGAVIPPVTPRAYWADGSGNELGSGADTFLDVLVKLIVVGAPGGNNIDYEIYDSDCLLYALDTSCSDLIRSGLSAASDTSGRAILDYTFTLADFTGDNDNEDQLELFFVAKSGAYNQQSEMINLKKEIIGVIEVAREGCAQFDELNECDNAPESVWRRDEADIEGLSGKIKGVGCGNSGADSDGNFQVECSCYWDGSNICKFRWETIRSSPPVPAGVVQDCIGGCNIETQYDECVDNSASITYSTTFASISGADCSSGNYDNLNDKNDCDNLNGESTSVLCGFAPSLILPFFGAWQFMTSVFSIIIIYVLIIFRRKA